MSELLKFIKQFFFEKFSQIQTTNFSISLHNSTKLINQFLAPSLVIATFATITYWGMKIFQTPSFIMDKEIHQTLLISNEPKFNQSKSLFGNIQLSTQNILLRGIVITSGSGKATLDGFAIFDINGKSSNPISIGETIGNGITLKTISQDSVTVSYLGNDINYPLIAPQANQKKSP